VWLKRVGEPDQWMLARTPPQSGHLYFFAPDRTFIDRLASESDHRRAKKIAQAALDRRTAVLEAVKASVSLAHTDAVAVADVEDRKFIIGIESETDDLPVEEVRRLWASSALKEKDVEIARAEELYRADFLETCRRIVQPHCPVDASSGDCVDGLAQVPLEKSRTTGR
jgi:hypothetical protein